MSGLNVGMMDLDEVELQQKASAGTPEEQRQANKIIPVRRTHHWLLVSILLGNAVAAEALPVVLNGMVDETLAIVFSVVFVLVCGEIIPQAILTGPSQLRIAAFLVPLLRFVMLVTLPISYPLSKLLDKILGEHNSEGQAMDLKQMVVAHQLVSEKMEKRGELSTQQYRMIHGAIDISDVTISACTLPMSEVYALSSSTVLNQNLMQEVKVKGFSRIPIYYADNRGSAFAILLAKRLIGLNTQEKFTIESAKLDLRKPLFVSPNESLLDLLNKFQAGHVHMAFVCEDAASVRNSFETRPNSCIGIITLEDVVEKLLNTEIDDEFDYNIVRGNHGTDDTLRNFDALKQIKKKKRRVGIRRTSWRKMKPPLDSYALMEDRPLLH